MRASNPTGRIKSILTVIELAICRRMIRFLITRVLFFVFGNWKAVLLFLGLVIFASSAFFLPFDLFATVASLILLLSFISGSNFFVYQALSKIKTAKADASLWALAVPKFKQYKKDLDYWITLVGLVSGVGLAAFLVVPSQIPSFPPELFKFLGAIVEATVTITFALIYWSLLFFLMERQDLEKAAIHAGIMSAFFNLSGAFATVLIAQYLGLNAIQDFSSAFIPYLFVFYVFSKQIPEYGLKAYSSLDSELVKIEGQIKETKEEIACEVYETRKLNLQTILSALEQQKERMEKTRPWFELGLDKIMKAENDYADFCSEMESARLDYHTRIGMIRRKEIGILVNEKPYILTRSRPWRHASFHLVSGFEPITKKNIRVIAGILSLREVAIHTTRFRRPRNAVGLYQIRKSRSQIAVIQSSMQDMPTACVEFDRKTLGSYEPAAIEYQFCKLKYEKLLFHSRECPSSFALKEFEKTHENLLDSIMNFQEQIKQRISDYVALERDHPNCYIVKQFKVLFGILGISALKDTLEELNVIRTKVSNRMDRLEILRKTLKLG